MYATGQRDSIRVDGEVVDLERKPTMVAMAIRARHY
jgi:hypothetical protein